MTTHELRTMLTEGGSALVRLLAMLYAFAATLIRDESEDCVHEAILRLRKYLSRHPMKEFDDPEAFARGVLYCTVQDHYRTKLGRGKRRRVVGLGDDPVVAAGTDGPAAPLERVEEAAANLRLVQLSLGRLKDIDASIIWRKYALNEDYRTIAVSLGMPEATVRSRAYRALRSLRDQPTSAAHRPRPRPRP